jgi:hypothetical protein
MKIRWLPRLQSSIGYLPHVFCVNVIRSLSHPKRYFIGSTENIDQRIKEHNEGKSLHTAKDGPWERRQAGTGLHAFALSRFLGREISLGKIIHGDDHATLKVKTFALTSEVRKVTGKSFRCCPAICCERMSRTSRDALGYEQCDQS